MVRRAHHERIKNTYECWSEGWVNIMQVLSLSAVRPDASTGSAVNTAFSTHCARPELVEGYLSSALRHPSTGSGRALEKK